MSIIPSIIINEHCSVSHSSNLVPIVPPWHDCCFWISILSKPVIRLSKIINYLLWTIWFSSWKNNWRRGICFRCNMNRVANISKGRMSNNYNHCNSKQEWDLWLCRLLLRLLLILRLIDSSFLTFLLLCFWFFINNLLLISVFLSSFWKRIFDTFKHFTCDFWNSNSSKYANRRSKHEQ